MDDRNDVPSGVPRPAFDPKRDLVQRDLVQRDLVQPATRAEATVPDYAKLVYTGNDVLNIGKGRLVLTYAGDTRRIQITCKSGKAAKRTQTLLRRDLRAARNNTEYNAVLDAFFKAIIEARDNNAGLE